ncbi:complement C1q tumor necrosis factor-related protein 3-like isoform X2 [Saccostrea echinata]|uniref:complement C1q tumor necrosis factor-related protein 3-like isoform X2 n=1 Tax=Saccostrea echinata TaxID=191078 RepID=UPI002A838701|nr:complement C1q tumor necrosis factor-related protein 3-like isoform X2 [Saccostrea echinata]
MYTLPAIGFSAKLSRDIQLGNGQAVKYDTVITNKGNGYNKWSGHFTAPLRGLYLFSCTILAQHPYSVHIELMKNGSKISTLYSTTSGQSSQSVVLILRKGDTVWTRQAWNGRRLHDHVGYNMFTGVLISENV